MSLLKTVRTTYEKTGNNNVGPTSDNTSRIALMRKLQVKAGYGDKKTVQLWGLNNVDKDGKTVGNNSGVSGDSGIRTYFRGIFPRMSF
jgi:hypothetical protein